MIRLTRFLVLGAALCVSGVASGATTWTLGPTPPANISLTGWANTVGSANTAIQVQPLGSNRIWYSGGWGINNLDGCTSCTGGDVGDMQSTAPEHAIDNNQRYEMLQISFTDANKVKLESVNIGWTSSISGADSDLTVLAYTGSGTPNIAGQTWGGATGLLANGWTLIGHYNGNNTTGVKTIQSAGPGGTYSSHWLVGAFNPLVGGTKWSDGSNLCSCSGSDYVKLFAVAGTLETPPPGGGRVSEPGSMALVGAALLGIVALRRRRVV